MDAKAGFCSNCRRGEHSLCASASCTCPDNRRHRNRPGYAQVPQAVPKGVDVITNKDFVAATALGDGLVWCDPPARQRGGASVDYKMLCKPCVDRSGQWARVRVYKSKSAASTAAKACRSQLGEGWEVKPVRIPEGSGLWVRWMGGD